VKSRQQSLAGRWTAEAAELEIDLAGLLPAAQRAASAAGPAPIRSSDELAGAALLAAGRSRAVFGRAEAAGHVAALLPTNGLSATDLLAQIESLTDRGPKTTSETSPQVPDLRKRLCGLAVAVGFEPTEELPPHTLSRRAPSAARTRHRGRL
jgi:hypothetical protein